MSSYLGFDSALEAFSKPYSLRADGVSVPEIETEIKPRPAQGNRPDSREQADRWQQGGQRHNRRFFPRQGVWGNCLLLPGSQSFTQEGVI